MAASTTAGPSTVPPSSQPPPPPPTTTTTTATYPPTAPQPSRRPTPDAHTPTTSYLVSTETDSIADLRLQITEDLSGASSSSRRPPRPLFFRQRTLSTQEEILDGLIDANTGHAAWTIHRPTRGWYLHIRSPALPPNSTIPIRPARPEFVTSTMGVLDPTATPLTFSLGTRVKWDCVARCKEWIGEVDRGESGTFEDVQLTEGQQGGNTSMDSITTSSSSSSSFTKGHNARTSSISSAAIQSVDQRHARRRSAGPSPDLRRMNLSGTFPKVAEGEQEQEEGPESSTDTKHLHPSDNTTAHRPPDHGRASPGDEPYRSGNGNTNHTHHPATHSNRATQCYFLLLDGAARNPPRNGTSPSNTTAPGRIPASASALSSSSRLGWAKWVWSLVPEPVRPPLAFDTSKSFSIRWIDVQPGVQQQQLQSIEVMRYEDTSGYWLWQSKTKGRFVFQEEAVRALAIDRAFWFAVALAYLDFLEERDGYNAASDG